MRIRSVAGGLAAVIGLIAMTNPLFGQNRETFAARLGWVPISGTERNDVAGQGSAVATLSGRKLSITGSFSGLPAPAAAVGLHRGVAMGARGPVIAQLDVTRGTGGTLSGEIDLTADQVAALRTGQLYLQVHGDKGVPPDNAILWGWLIP